MNMHARSAFSFVAAAAALLAVFGSAWAAEDDEIAQLTKPQSTMNFGAGYLFDDGPRFGQYNGIRDTGGYGLLDADIVKRDDATGTWFKFTGRNLGLENRQFRFEHQRQGDWGYFIDFSQTPRYEPYTATTGVTGIGNATLTVPAVPTAGSPTRLRTRREAVGLGFSKVLPGNWDLQVRFRNEEKDGARLFARGTSGGAGNFEFAPEPIDSSTQQLDVTLGYTGERLQLSGGYYGTMYDNHNTALNFTGGVGALSTFTPIGLPPDNRSHQLFLSGGYSFTPTTRGTFKAAYTRATQDDNFITGANVPLAPGIGGNLDGRVDTTLVQAGITARPMPKLSLLANLRYEDRDDRTPVRLYNTLATPTSTHNGRNEPRSIRTVAGKLEASYALPMSFRLTGGIDYDEKERSISPVRIVSHRDRTEETSYRVELRRSMSETVTGALAYVYSERNGSDFQTTVLNNGTVGSNLIAPIHLADRERNKVRLTVNWTPTEPLSLQFRVDEARDNYDGDRSGLELGLRDGEARNYSVDASYAFSEKWQGTAWVSRNDTRIEQSSRTSGGQLWVAELRNVGDSFGLGVRGKPYARLDVGADLHHSDIDDEYRQRARTGAAIASLPDVFTRLTSLKLFGQYAIQKNAGLRLDYVYDRFSTNDWSWRTWTYTDGTRLSQDPTQEINFVGISGYYKW